MRVLFPFLLPCSETFSVFPAASFLRLGRNTAQEDKEHLVNQARALLSSSLLSEGDTMASLSSSEQPGPLHTTQTAPRGPSAAVFEGTALLLVMAAALGLALPSGALPAPNMAASPASKMAAQSSHHRDARRAALRAALSVAAGSRRHLYGSGHRAAGRAAPGGGSRRRALREPAAGPAARECP